MILVLSKSALDRDDVESMLTGRLLFAEWGEIGVVVTSSVQLASVLFGVAFALAVLGSIFSSAQD